MHQVLFRDQLSSAYTLKIPPRFAHKRSVSAAAREIIPAIEGYNFKGSGRICSLSRPLDLSAGHNGWRLRIQAHERERTYEVDLILEPQRSRSETKKLGPEVYDAVAHQLLAAHYPVLVHPLPAAASMLEELLRPRDAVAPVESVWQQVPTSEADWHSRYRAVIGHDGSVETCLHDIVLRALSVETERHAFNVEITFQKKEIPWYEREERRRRRKRAYFTST